MEVFLQHVGKNNISQMLFLMETLIVGRVRSEQKEDSLKRMWVI